ncbi:hypothetical protein C2E23DRAFT_559159 [Lenzites betulinus]|nr:hypothetical protein C2E23DRAFT_559159 [Lenzites betulinus]
MTSLDRLRYSMHRKNILVSPERFMESYVPTVPGERCPFPTILDSLPVASDDEGDVHDSLADALNGADICPGLEFACTSARCDDRFGIYETTVVGLYPSDRIPQGANMADDTSQRPGTDWSAVELCIVSTTDAETFYPVSEIYADDRPVSHSRVFSYAESTLQWQQRTFLFMVLLLGNDCVLVRFDRAGYIMSQAFNYKTDGDNLIEFFWRYARWAASTRGHDPTAERILPCSPLAEQMKARAQKDKDTTNREDYVRRMFEESLNPRWYWWTLRVEPDGKEGEDRFFVVGKPNFQAPGLVGRGTRGYVALPADNIADGKFCYLKDAWRVVGLDIDKEGTILEHLNEQKVKYTPTLECHGDVGDPNQQVTQTDALWDEVNERKEVEERNTEGDTIVSPVKKHRHYRIVVKEVGQPMSEFTSSRQLVHALWCCITAHSEAYKIGVIHRDISASNVLLYYDAKTKKSCGLLNDWELSKKTDSPRPRGRQLDRTGTWQFMSAMTLIKPWRRIEVEDELESFFNVLLYFSVRFLPHNCDQVGDFMHTYFDDYSTLANTYRCGFYKRYCMKVGSLDLDLNQCMDRAKPERPEKPLEKLTFGWPTPTGAPEPGVAHPLNEVITTILKWIKGRYDVLGFDENVRDPERKSRMPKNNEEFDFDDDTTEPESSDESTSDSQDPASARRQDEANAAKLHSHSAILALLKKAGKGDLGDWPMVDKIPDQLPKKGYQQDADPAITSPAVSKAVGSSRKPIMYSSTASSRKRVAAEVGELEVAGPSKQSK